MILQSVTTILILLQSQSPYLDIDLNRNGKIELIEYQKVTELFLADGYEITDTGDPRPVKKTFRLEEQTVQLPENVKLTLVRIPAGSYRMGTWSLDIWGERVELKPVLVAISQDFYLGKYEVSQEQYQAVMGENTSTFTGKRYPVHRMGIEKGQEFIQKLNSIVEGGGFRLPTSAEWEYACRAGTTTAYYWGDRVAEAEPYEWVDSNSQYSPFPVGLLEPNPWGLYDMQGNVSEFVLDGLVFDNSYFEKREVSIFSGSLLVDPIGIRGNEAGYIRGGDISSPSNYYQTYSDSGYISRNRYLKQDGLIGFRVARNVVPSVETKNGEWMVH